MKIFTNTQVQLNRHLEFYGDGKTQLKQNDVVVLWTRDVNDKEEEYGKAIVTKSWTRVDLYEAKRIE